MEQANKDYFELIQHHNITGAAWRSGQPDTMTTAGRRDTEGVRWQDHPGMTSSGRHWPLSPQAPLSGMGLSASFAAIPAA